MAPSVSSNTSSSSSSSSSIVKQFTSDAFTCIVCRQKIILAMDAHYDDVRALAWRL